MLMWRLAIRNLGRNRRRTSITMMSVAFGVWLAVTFTGAGDYVYTNMLNTGARMGFGHVTVQPKGYQLAPGLDRRIDGVSQIRSRVVAAPEVEDAVVRITGQAMLATAARSIGGGFFAVDPQHETARHNIFLRAMIEGEVLQPGDKRGVLIGQVMAEKLDLRIGKRLVYTAVDVSGEIVSEVAKVRGIFQTGVSEVDSSVVVLPLDAVRSVLGYSPTEATMVAVFLSDHRRAGDLRARWRESLTDETSEVMTWRETQAELASIVALDRGMNYLFQILVGILIGAGVLNTILMSVLERRREFGVMMAIGVTPGQLFWIVVAESLLIGVSGLAVGCLICIPWFWYMSEVGIDFTSLSGGDMEAAGIIVDPVLKLALYPENGVVIALGVVAITVISGLYPAWQAGRTPPVESIKAI